MRINPDERRKLNRRLRSRIAPAIFSGIKQIPKIAIVVSATFFMTPEARSEVDKKQSAPILVLSAEAEDDVTTYSKEDLEKTMPENPSITLNERILSEMNSLLRQMGKSAGSTEGKESLTKNPSRRDYFDHLQAFKEAPKTTKANPEKMRRAFAAGTQEALSDRVKSKIGLFGAFKSGLKMNFDIKNLFSSSDKEVKKSSGKVRYGLVLKDIKPDKDAPDRAAIGEDLNEMQYAGHADVEWTIGPLSEKESRKLFSVPNANMDSQKNSGSASSTNNSQPKDLWDSVLPEGKFEFSAKPDDVENLNSVESENNLPPVMWSMKQSQDYWLLQYKTKTDGTKIEAFHTFKVPIYGTLKVGRRFDDNWNVISTSAYDILIDKRAPIVSIHYMNLEERFKGTLDHAIDTKTSVNLTAQGLAATPIKNDTADRKWTPEKYTAGFTKKF
jgi:hypothetical protein